MRVLLVDDSDAVRLTLGAILEDAGHEIALAESLSTARAQLGTTPFDAVILDVHLGDGLGSSLVPDVRAALPSAAVVVLSGEALPLPPGVDDVLVKGDDPDALVRQLERAVAARTT